MFVGYYKLQAHPFERQPAPRFFFESGQQRSALKVLEKGLIAGGGFTVITGGEGMGKTAILDFTLSRLDPGQFTVASLAATPIGPDDMLREIASLFGLACQELGGDETRQRLADYLTGNLKAGKRPVLFVDQCEKLPTASLRQLTSLADIRFGDQQALHIVLLGRSQLRQTLAGDDFMARSDKRVGGYHLQPLESGDTRGLIEHRLRVADWRGDPDISAGAFEMIFLKTGGVPGRITAFCAELFEFAAAGQRHSIGNSTVRKVAAKQQKDRLKGDRGTAAATGTPDSDRFHTPESQPAPEPAGISVTPAPRRPSRWRRSLVYGEYAAGMAITALIVWQVGAGLLGQNDASPQPAKTVTIALPAAPVESPPAAEAGSDSDAVAMSQADSAAPSPGADGEASEPDAPELYIVDFGDKLDAATAEPETAQTTAVADAPAPYAPVIAAEVALPDPPAARLPDNGAVDQAEDPYADLSAEPAAAVPGKPDQTEPDAPVMDVAEKPTALDAAQEPRTMASVESSSAEMTENPALSATDDRDQSPLSAALSKPVSLLAEKPVLAPLESVMDPTEVGDKLLPFEALSDPRMDPQDREHASAEPPATPEATIPPAAKPELDQQALALGAGHAEAPQPTVNLAQSEPASPQVDTAASPDLAVTTVTLTRNVVDKEPVDATDWFAASDGEVYAFARIKNLGAPTQVTFAWYRGDRLAASTKLKVGRSASWRTWSKSRIEPGNWRIVITDESGKLLAENAFTVE